MSSIGSSMLTVFVRQEHSLVSSGLISCVKANPSGLTAYTTSAHIARATLEAVCYQTRAVLDVIEKESGVRLDTLKVDGQWGSDTR